MNKKELYELVKTGEGQNLEFKLKPSNIQKELSALANSEGGKILLGIEDDGTVVGLKKLNEQKSRIYDMAHDCEPSIDIKIEEVDGVLVIDVKESERAVKAPNGFYLRQGAISKKLQRKDILEMVKGKKDTAFGERICHDFKYPEDFKDQAFSHFLELASITQSIDKEDILVNLGAARRYKDGLYFTNAGVLMFGEQPEKFFPHAKIICGRYASRDKVKIEEKKIISEPLIPSIREAVKFIIDNTNQELIEGTERKQKTDYPVEVVREAVVNAVMHRDYSNSTENITIEIYPDEILIENPGGLVGDMKIDDLSDKSIRRNPRLANLLEKAKFSELMGTGINRMNYLMEQKGLPLPQFEENGRFKVELRSEKEE